MDSRALSEATGVRAGTINAWIQRGWLPSVSVEVSGRRRDFDIATATHIAIMAELMPFGFGAPLASWAAALVFAGFKKEHPYCLIRHSVRPPRSDDPPKNVEQAPPEVQQAIEHALDITNTVLARMPHILSAIGQESRLLIQHLGPDARLSRVLPNLRPDQKPSVYVIIDVALITARMRQAEKEWQHARKHGRAGRGPSVNRVL